MALASATSRNNYVGAGNASVYAYSFRIIANTDLLVTVRDTANVETTLALTTDYTVSGVGAANGGNVTLVNSSQAWLTGGNLKTNYKLTIRRVRPVTQTTDIRNQGDFFPETHEDSFDHGIMVSQQIQDSIDRSVRLPETIPSSTFNPAIPASVIETEGRTLVVNSAKNGWSMGASSTVDVARMFSSKTYAQLKADAAAEPTLLRWGWATDIKQLVFYTADSTVGDGGWIIVGG